MIRIRLAVCLVLAAFPPMAARAAATARQSATLAETMAAAEVNRYLTRLGVKDSVFVCRQGSAEASSIKPALAKLELDGFAIAVRGLRTYLVGADDRGVLYAAYAYLHERGCRWLAPEFAFDKGAHEFVPKTAVSFAQQSDFISAPALKYRKLYVEEGHSRTVENLKQLIAWMPKARFNTLVIPIDYQGRGRVKWDNWRAELTPELQRRAITIEVGGHRAANGDRAERRKTVDELSAFLQQHQDDGVFVWHTRMEPARLYARYGAGA